MKRLKGFLLSLLGLLKLRKKPTLEEVETVKNKHELDETKRETATSKPVPGMRSVSGQNWLSGVGRNAAWYKKTFLR